SVVLGSAILSLVCGCAQQLPQLPSAQTNGAVVPDDANADTFIRMGDRLLRRGDAKSAANMYARAQALSPNNATIYARLGDVAWQRGQLNAAAGLYGQALRIDQTNPDALLGRARALALADETDASMLLIDDLIKNHGTDYRSLALKAMLFDLRGDHDSAQTLFESALEERPSDTNLMVSLAYSHALGGDYRAAVERLRPLGQNQATAPAGQFALADVYALSGQTDVGLELRRASGGGQEVSGADRVYLERLPQLTPSQQARAIYFRTLPTLDQQEPATAADQSGEPTEAAASLASTPAQQTSQSGDKQTALANYWVQLASFKSLEALELGWYQIQRENPELTSRLLPRVESLTIEGKGRFHRLYAGAYATQADAKQTCAALRNAELGCVIVVGQRQVQSLAQLLADR
ncbi:MAG: tetratricopeptide repeat protein, partial [Pseudomonadota bacterium]